MLANWILEARPYFDFGIWGYDSMLYHMPLAAKFAQTGSTLGMHQLEPRNFAGLTPANSELFHGIGLVFMHRDVLSPLLNFGWMGMILLAAWCVGRPFGAGLASVLAVAILLVTTSLLHDNPANAYSDTASIALVLSGAAIVVNAFNLEQPLGHAEAGLLVPPLIPAGLAVGLAAGSKLLVLAPVVALSIGVIVIAGTGLRALVARTWLLTVLAGGSYWYLRNLVATGNPLPWLKLGVGPLALPVPDHVVWSRPEPSLARYVLHADIWRDYIAPGFAIGFGHPWYLVTGLAFGGALAAVAFADNRAIKVVGVVALVSMAAYIFTPTAGAGPLGAPIYIGGAVRYADPGFALGLAALPTIPALRSGILRLPVLLFLGLILATRLHVWADSGIADAVLLCGVAMIVALLGASAVASWSRLRLGAMSAVLLLVAIGAYWPQAQSYLRNRYLNVWPGLDVSIGFRWANDVKNARIAIGGTTATAFQYGYYGRDSSNRVVYVADHRAHGGITPFETCEEWRAAVNAGRFQYLVTSPTINPNPGELWMPGFSPEDSWTSPDPAAQLIVRTGPVAVYRLAGPMDPAACARLKPPPYVGLPPLLHRP